ncbi:MAG: ABC transporter substrate-binding protein [Candidatus Poribacteria bacterium]|nr:MAG: ABC transporter substrate-binding protein [Candidatus Poribacteria bacterium]
MRGLFLVGGLLLSLSVFASGEEPPLRVLMAEFPPLVMVQEGRPIGFDVELWEAIAQRLERAYTVQVVPFRQLLPEIEAGRADAGIAGITITRARETRMDFSHPYMESGLGVLVRAQRQAALGPVLRTLLAPERLRWVLALVGFVFLCGHLLWLAERGQGAINDRYIPGICEAFWCVMATVTTVGYGDIAPKTWLGRLAAVGVMLTGIAFFGVVIAQVSAGLTLQQLHSEIRGVEDLRGRRVATVAGSTSAERLQALGAQVVAVDGIEAAYPLLLAGSADAVVFDAPALMYYAHGEGAGRVVLAGPLFDVQYYGIAVPAGSPLREAVNRALLEVRETGRYEEIYRRWFGAVTR